MIEQKCIEKTSGLKFDNFELVHRYDDYYSLNGHFFSEAKSGDLGESLTVIYKLIVPVNTNKLFSLSDNDFLAKIMPAATLPANLVTNLLKAKNKIKNNIDLLSNIYDFNNDLHKGNFTIVFKNDFTLTDVSLKDMIEFTFTDKDKRPSIMNLTISLLGDVKYQIRKDLDSIHDESDISDCVFSILQEPKLVTVIDDLSIDYTLEELIKFKDLLHMIEY